MIKIGKQKEWIETVLGTVSGLNVNTNPNLDFETQVATLGTPVATPIIAEGQGNVEGNVLKHSVPIEIWIIERADGDYTGIVEDIVNALEGSAYPDFYESGDPSHAPGSLMRYNWRIWGMTKDVDSGSIIIRMTITIDYINISER